MAGGKNHRRSLLLFEIHILVTWSHPICAAIFVTLVTCKECGDSFGTQVSWSIFAINGHHNWVSNDKTILVDSALEIT